MTAADLRSIVLALAVGTLLAGITAMLLLLALSVHPHKPPAPPPAVRVINA